MLRAFSFTRITLKFPARTKLTEKLEKANTKAYIYRLNLFQKAWYYLTTHKKKNIFFGALLGIAYHYDLHGGIYRWFTVVTPAQRVSNIILRKKQRPNDRFCVEPETSLQPDVKKDLVDFFLECDRGLERGLPRGLMVEIATELKWVQDRDKYIGGFLWESGFRKEVRQKKASMRLDQFLRFFEEMKRKTNLPEDQLLALFMQAVPAKLQAVKARENERKGKTAKKETETRERTMQVFTQAGKPLNPELEELEVQQEQLVETFKELSEKPVKSLADMKRMKALEQAFITKEQHRSKIYS
jgi:hypothetical protein